MDPLGILEKNPKITNLGIFDGATTQLKQINEMYPNVVNLAFVNAVYAFADLERSIEMDHVERFLFSDEQTYKFEKFIQFKRLKELQWYSTNPPFNVIKNHSNQIEILGIEYPIVTDVDLMQMSDLKKLERVSFGLDPVAKIRMTGNGLATFVNNVKQLAGLRLKRAKKDFVKEVYAAFEASGLADWIETPLDHLDEVSHVYFKNPTKNVEWDDQLQFLQNNLFLGQ